MVGLETYTVVDQFYILPYCKITYTRNLYGFYEVALGWGKWGIAIQW